MVLFAGTATKGLEILQNTSVLKWIILLFLLLKNKITVDALIFLTAKQTEKVRIIDQFQQYGSGGFALGVGGDNKHWMAVGGNELLSAISTPLNQWYVF